VSLCQSCPHLLNAGAVCERGSDALGRVRRGERGGNRVDGAADGQQDNHNPGGHDHQGHSEASICVQEGTRPSPTSSGKWPVPPRTTVAAGTLSEYHLSHE